jgi:2-dehydro-3-deoxyphosphogluconate aldolase/(4S)-4-hydroxy-2-oxoglutarate aldolase
MRETALERIRAGKIIAILRGDFKGLELEIAAVLVQAKITAIEVTLNSENVFATIERLAMGFGDKVAIGAGTVLRVDQMQRAGAAGARFIISPNRDAAVIEATKREGLFSMPGCFTPSEICEALAAGADAIKLFPVTSLGPTFVRAMRGPFGGIRMVPTGGVTPNTAPDYMAAGAWAVGVGSELVGADVVAIGGLDRLQTNASAFVAAVGGRGIVESKFE